MSERRVIVCNYMEATSSVSKGSKCYVLEPSHDSVSIRVRVFARSRSGRWIDKVESVKRLGNFRAATLVDDDPVTEHMAKAWVFPMAADDTRIAFLNEQCGEIKRTVP